MPTFPRDITDFRDALLAYVHPAAPVGVDAGVWDGVGQAIDDAQATVSPVVQLVQVFDALRPHAESLDLDTLMLLTGAAFLVHKGQFHGRGDEAFDVFTSAVAALAA